MSGEERLGSLVLVESDLQETVGEMGVGQCRLVSVSPGAVDRGGQELLRQRHLSEVRVAIADALEDDVVPRSPVLRSGVEVQAFVERKLMATETLGGRGETEDRVGDLVLPVAFQRQAPGSPQLGKVQPRGVGPADPVQLPVELHALQQRVRGDAVDPADRDDLGQSQLLASVLVTREIALLDPLGERPRERADVVQRKPATLA